MTTIIMHITDDTIRIIAHMTAMILTKTRLIMHIKMKDTVSTDDTKIRLIVTTDMRAKQVLRVS